MIQKLIFKNLIVHGDKQNSYDIVSHTENDYNQSQLYFENREMQYLASKELQDMLTLFEGVNICRIWYDIAKTNGEISCKALKGNVI